MLTDNTNLFRRITPSPLEAAGRAVGTAAAGVFGAGALRETGRRVGEAISGGEQCPVDKGDSTKFSSEASEPKCECSEDRAGAIGKALGEWWTEQGQGQGQQEGGQSQDGERGGIGPLFPNNPNRPIGMGPWPSLPSGPSMPRIGEPAMPRTPRIELPPMNGPMPSVPFDRSWILNASGAAG